MSGKLNVSIILAELFLSLNWCSKFKRADLPKFVLNEGFIIEQLLLRQRWCLFDFCTKLRMCLEALFFATFLWVKLWNKYCLLLCNVGKFKSDLPVVTENFLGADTIILIALFCTFSMFLWPFVWHLGWLLSNILGLAELKFFTF